MTQTTATIRVKRTNHGFRVCDECDNTGRWFDASHGASAACGCKPVTLEEAREAGIISKSHYDLDAARTFLVETGFLSESDRRSLFTYHHDWIRCYEAERVESEENLPSRGEVARWTSETFTAEDEYNREILRGAILMLNQDSNNNTNRLMAVATNRELQQFLADVLAS